MMSRQTELYMKKNIQKLTILISILLIVACAQLSRPEEQPIVETGKDVYFTTCSGFAESWGTCFQKAKRSCSGSNYSIIKKTHDSSGVHRELTFQCKK